VGPGRRNYLATDRGEPMTVVAARRPVAAAGNSDIQMSALLLLALAVAISGLHSILSDVTWWFSAFGVMFVVFTVAAVARFYLQRRWLGSVAAVVAAVLVLTVFFAADTAVLGFVPTLSTVARVGTLIDAGNTSIANQTIPAIPATGIQFLVCAAVAGIAIVMDALAIWLRVPAFVGLPLLVVVFVPSLVLASLSDGFTFEFTAAVYLLIILGRGRRIQPAVAISTGVIAVLGALVIPAILPPVLQGGSTGSGVGALAADINPIINLGADLRRTDSTPALSYTTTSSTGEYLRLTTLDNFEGKEWEPATPKLRSKNVVSDIGSPPGLSSDVKVGNVSTSVQVANATGSWLPIPYPSLTISGLTGKWSWEDGTLSVRSAATSMQGERYSVVSLDVQPTLQQMENAGSSSSNPLAKVPAGLDPIIAATAKKVVAGAKTDFDRAIALQDWFRGGTFTYSTKAPAAAGYDGSGLNVIVPFLKAKSGYCVHFATTMAVMARTLGIPSRIAVGFLPGTLTHVGAKKTAVYEVTSSNLHAWPELYFKGVGWVRFEPTPSKGFEPTFPSAPGLTSGSLPSGTATDLPTATSTGIPLKAPNLPKNNVPQTSAIQSNAVNPVNGFGTLGVVAVLLALAAPATIRIGTRRSRMERIRTGVDPAGWTWQELRETARDLGVDARETSTPSQLAAQLSNYLATAPRRTADAIVALARLRELVEDESYGVPSYRYNDDELATNLTTVLQGLRSATGPLPRLAATILPPTLVDRVLGRTAIRA
jgi:transglutaminase-like putative cysteine protease